MSQYRQRILTSVDHSDTSERFAQTRRQIEKATQDIRQQSKYFLLPVLVVKTYSYTIANQLRQLLAAIGTPNDDIELRRRM